MQRVLLQETCAESIARIAFRLDDDSGDDVGGIDCDDSNVDDVEDAGMSDWRCHPPYPDSHETSSLLIARQPMQNSCNNLNCTGRCMAHADDGYVSVMPMMVMTDSDHAHCCKACYG